MGYLNLGSLILGILAWILPVLAIIAFSKKQEIYGTYMVYGSLASAMLALVFVITYNNHLVSIEDWSALMDTKDAFQFVTIVMVTITIALNGLALVSKVKNMDKK